MLSLKCLHNWYRMWRYFTSNNCIVRIHDWMASNRLKLNEDKTQVIWLGTRQQLSKLTENRLTLPNATVQFSTVVNDLDVLIDSQLSMSNHIAALILLLPPETTQAH